MGRLQKNIDIFPLSSFGGPEGIFAVLVLVVVTQSSAHC
jgi:hypothetical protein